MALQYSAGPYYAANFEATTPFSLVEGIRVGLVSAGWTQISLYGSGLIQFASNPTGGTVTIGGKVYTFQSTLSNVDGNVQISGTLADTLANLAAAINLSGGGGYAASTTLHPTVTAAVEGGTAVRLTAKSGGAQFITTAAAAGGATANPLTGGGYKFDSPATPQGFRVRVKVSDEGYGATATTRATRVDVRFSNQAESKIGGLHQLAVAEKKLRIIAHPYQVFVFPPDSPGTSFDVVMGGVPFVDPDNQAVTTEIWWSGSNDLGEQTFRAHVHPAWASTSWVFNADLKNDASSGIGTPRLYGVYGWSFVQGSPKAQRWVNSCWTNCQAGLMFGTTAAAVPRSRGMLWDAAVLTGPFRMGRVDLWNGHNWECLTDGVGSPDGCLFLVVP